MYTYTWLNTLNIFLIRKNMNIGKKPQAISSITVTFLMVVLRKKNKPKTNIKAGTFTLFLDRNISLCHFRIIFVFLTVLQRDFYLFENSKTVCLRMRGKFIYSTLKATIELNWWVNEYFFLYIYTHTYMYTYIYIM